ncbi:3-oxo-tetronate kinase [Rhizobium sp. SSA_523]|uniref:3-oxo-tetronate kinase n=1 Tax=Rhizobium sp. SSA_523 TaxID=2952477 RepID=UPI002090CC09|nr:3-oxo-tetronate kinase [Rhizobium sp. SSA_523]MCO5732289.1 four-carbon acid sugar kinase family protein [Rhizobium sp. SSA_523]WKC21308.1 four-carbon acid sugar kinase family protein [Rhizobium sp. SSA_523]
MSIVLGAIADDFTGATDLAGLLARSGVPVGLRMGLPQPEETAEAPSPIEIVALKIRTQPVEQAIDEARQALRWLRQQGATRIYWKYCSTFDSTPAGNIGPVAEALMADLEAAQTIYCPAFPENGRSIFMGHLFVGEQPLDESPMKDHPLTPMRDSSLLRLLAPQVQGRVGLANRHAVAAGVEALRGRLADLKTQGVAHVIVDAVADSDLDTIAAAVADWPLITGGSALASPLPHLLQAAGALPAGGRMPAAARTPPTGGRLVLSGSCSAMTRSQVAEFCRHAASFRLDPLRLAEQGTDEARRWLDDQDPESPKIIFATAEPEEVRAAQQQLGAGRAGDLVEDALADLAKHALQVGVRRFVIAGGETSGAVTRALAVRRLQVGREIAPGVPWTYALAGGAPIALALKSGNFGRETFFADAFEALEAG